MPTIIFNPEAVAGGTGWFDFNPERMGWGFEETVARINRLSPDQDLFADGDKSLFTVYGYLFMQEGGHGHRFQLYDHAEDRRIHVMFVDGERPKELTKRLFVSLLAQTLQAVQPLEFEAQYSCVTDDRLCWPPVPTKAEAVGMAHKSLEELVGAALLECSTEIPKTMIVRARKALRALEEAF